MQLVQQRVIASTALILCNRIEYFIVLDFKTIRRYDKRESLSRLKIIIF